MQSTTVKVKIQFQLHIYTICMIIGYTIAAPVGELPENQLPDIVTTTKDNPGPPSTYETEIYRPREIIFEIIETKDAARTKDVLVIDEIIDEPLVFDNNDDMEVAETHLFRPLFRYRAQLEKRERLRQSRL